MGNIYCFKTHFCNSDSAEINGVEVKNVNNSDYRFYSCVSFLHFLDKITRFTRESEQIFYSHSLAMDISPAIYSLLLKGFSCVNGVKYESGKISVLIDKKGKWYQVKFIYNGIKFTFRDSRNLIPFDVDKIAKDFDIHCEKYIDKHCEIVKAIIAADMNKYLTIGSNCMAMYKKTINFNKLFPVIDSELDTELRGAYYGGWCYVNPEYEDKALKGVDGYVYDVNSLYPYVMLACEFPIGEPQVITENIEDHMNGCYIVKFKASFTLKDDGLPFIKNENIGQNYVKDSGLLPMELTLCSVDLELFFQNYNVIMFEPVKLFKFRTQSKLFDKYISYWYNVKKTATSNTKRTVSKLFLNNLGGKFGTKTDTGYRVLELKDGKLKYSVHDSKKDPVYVPVAIFMTAYARKYIISAARKAGKKFIYCDTDSIHSLGELNIAVSDKIGDFKEEHKFDRARYVHKKTYVIHSENEYIIKASGATDEVKFSVADKHKEIEEIFTHGLELGGKLQRKLVKEGYILQSSPFKIA